MSKTQYAQTTSTEDRNAHLNSVKTDFIKDMTASELEAYQKCKENNQEKLDALYSELYLFLSGYTHNSGIFINNFFRKRIFELYTADKFGDFDFDASGVMPNFYDNLEFSKDMVENIEKLKKNRIAYYPITVDYIKALKALYDGLYYAPRMECDTVLYRGCSTIERNGMSGIVSVTTDYSIAKQFSRGTLLKINVPEGTKCLDVKSIIKKEQQKGNIKNEILLPPCDYEIISKRVVEKVNEPNNRLDTTTVLEIKVIKQLDLLEEFLKVMEDPVQKYKEDVLRFQNDEYDKSLSLLKEYVLQSRGKCVY
jgi:hypothetical protein